MSVCYSERKFITFYTLSVVQFYGRWFNPNSITYASSSLSVQFVIVHLCGGWGGWDFHLRYPWKTYKPSIKRFQNRKSSTDKLRNTQNCWSEVLEHRDRRIQASAAEEKKASFFWDVTQRRLVVTDVSDQMFVPIFRGQAVQGDDSFTLEFGKEKLSRNVGNYQSRLSNIPEER